MKKQYKNKRDFYKAEADRNIEQANFWKVEAEAKQKKIVELSQPKKEVIVKCAWFCPNCRVVQEGTKGINFDLEGSRCLYCGKLGVMAVGNMPF